MTNLTLDEVFSSGVEVHSTLKGHLEFSWVLIILGWPKQRARADIFHIFWLGLCLSDKIRISDVQAALV
jgi:hypothetical protein